MSADTKAADTKLAVESQRKPGHDGGPWTAKPLVVQGRSAQRDACEAAVADYGPRRSPPSAARPPTAEQRRRLQAAWPRSSSPSRSGRTAGTRRLACGNAIEEAS